MDTTTSGYVLLSTGEYSDYSLTAYRVLKPFKIADVYAELMKVWIKDPYGFEDTPTQEEFIAFAIKEEYLQDADELQEIHIGCYGNLKIDEDLANTTFFPRKLE